MIYDQGSVTLITTEHDIEQATQKLLFSALLSMLLGAQFPLQDWLFEAII